MQSGWRVGSLFGIPLFLDLSWFISLVLIALPIGSGKQQEWGAATAYSTGFLMAFLLLLSVLLHELGHSLVAKSQGIKVNSITLFLFGGIASIEQESRTPGQAFQVAIAGPAVSLLLAGCIGLLGTLLPTTIISPPVSYLIVYLAWMNLLLAGFNLLPGLPLDGGQVLKALIWKVTGSRLKGVHLAAQSGKTLGWLAIILGLTVLLPGNGLWIALLGWFVLQNASSYDRITTIQEALLALKANDAMTREFRVVDADMTLRRFADDYLLETNRPTVYFAASDGRYRGMVMTDDMRFVERSEWDYQPLHKIIQSLTAIPTVEEATPLVDVIQKMESQELRSLSVLSPAGAVSGVIDRGEIVRALAAKLNMQVPDVVIKQIKDSGSYPQGFNLGAIAQAAAESLPPSRR
ncbi:MAG TPA: site-2 protease family protein [Microcoleaceae cyanobacterium]